MPIWLMVYEFIEVILGVFKADVIDDSPGKVFFYSTKGIGSLVYVETVL